MNWREFQSLQRVALLEDRFVSFVEAGSGDPLVLLHGIPTWGYLWHGLLPRLTLTHRVLIPDLPGFGFSDKSDRFDRSIARQAEFILAWLDDLELERVSVVGHELGGGVALRLATLCPERVQRVALLNPVCYDSWPVEALRQLGHPEVRRRLSAPTVAGLLKLMLKQGFRTLDDGLLAGLLAPYQTEVGKLSLIRNAAALNANLTLEVVPLLPRIAAPVLILWGEDDPFQPVTYAERLNRDIPGARLIRLADARQYVMWDQAASVALHLQDFLAEPFPPPLVEPRGHVAAPFG